MNVRYFDEWKNKVIKQLFRLVNSLKLSNKRTLAVTNSEKHDLNMLKSHFIMTRNNISFTVKVLIFAGYYFSRFFMETKIREN